MQCREDKGLSPVTYVHFWNSAKVIISNLTKQVACLSLKSWEHITDLKNKGSKPWARKVVVYEWTLAGIVKRLRPWTSAGIVKRLQPWNSAVIHSVDHIFIDAHLYI
jgi:hypothetical protein